ncbi:hypothetical protein ASE93_12385 [Serratia sp. Leaf50]|nr:hypothetical protein ASE93_12385 [Serratia sp. Leaf50]
MKTIMIAAALAFVAGGCWWAENLHWTKEVFRLQKNHSVQLKAISDRALIDISVVLERTQLAQRLAAELDKKYTKELADALVKNEKLKADVTNGSRRVLFARANLATCQLAKDRSSATGSVGDADQVELSAAAGRTVLAIREGIVKDQAKLEYLQRYLEMVATKNRLKIPANTPV